MTIKPQRPPFQPLNADMIDEKIERLAREKGVGAFVKPIEGEQGGRPDQADTSGSTPEQPESAATPRSRMKTVNLELPDYVWTDLKIRAAHRQTSVRHIIMCALRADGLSIAEADMVEDGRRLRGSQRPAQLG